MPVMTRCGYDASGALLASWKAVGLQVVKLVRTGEGADFS